MLFDMIVILLKAILEVRPPGPFCKFAKLVC